MHTLSSVAVCVTGCVSILCVCACACTCLSVSGMDTCSASLLVEPANGKAASDHQSGTEISGSLSHEAPAARQEESPRLWSCERWWLLIIHLNMHPCVSSLNSNSALDLPI